MAYGVLKFHLFAEIRKADFIITQFPLLQSEILCLLWVPREAKLSEVF